MSIPEISASGLAQALNAGQDIHVLDIRTPQQLQSGKVEVEPGSFHNVPLDEFRLDADDHGLDLSPDHEYAVVCTRGNDSEKIAVYLNARGFRTSSMSGGMFAWMGVTVPRELPPPADFDRFVQFDRIGKGALAYLLVSDREALIVDPSRHLTDILESVDAAGAKVVAIADTHAHADYISGGPDLAARRNAPYYLHPADAVYPYDGTPGKIAFTPAEEGTTIKVGRGTVSVLHTPGHTEGSVTYLAGDVALTGDFIFIKTVGRPDLGEQTAAWTGVLFDSLERARRECPDTQRVCPAHYSDPAERNADGTFTRTFGELRASNEQLAMADRQTFTDWVAGRAGSFPEQYRRIKAINVGLELSVTDDEMNELEAGKNQCAL